MENEINEAEIKRAQAAPPPPPAPPAPSSPTTSDDSSAEAPPAPPETTELPPAPRGEEVAEPESKLMDQAWPFRGYEGPQPWEAENTPELTTNHLMISSGSAGPEVADLADLLARLGYSTSISQGQN